MLQLPPLHPQQVLCVPSSVWHAFRVFLLVSHDFRLLPWFLHDFRQLCSITSRVSPKPRCTPTKPSSGGGVIKVRPLLQGNTLIRGEIKGCAVDP